MSSDVPAVSHGEMFTALAVLCKVDPKLKRGQLNSVAKQLREAGYTPADLDKFASWWKSQDWRGQRGDPPVINLVPSLILQAVQWVPWVPPVPGQPKKNGYDVSALRSWHYQWRWDEWITHVAGELGYQTYDNEAFKNWYASDGYIPDGDLAGWYEQRENGNKETNDG